MTSSDYLVYFILGASVVAAVLFVLTVNLCEKIRNSRKRRTAIIRDLEELRADIRGDIQRHTELSKIEITKLTEKANRDIANKKNAVIVSLLSNARTISKSLDIPITTAVQTPETKKPIQIDLSNFIPRLIHATDMKNLMNISEHPANQLSTDVKNAFFIVIFDDDEAAIHWRSIGAKLEIDSSTGYKPKSYCVIPGYIYNTQNNQYESAVYRHPLDSSLPLSESMDFADQVCQETPRYTPTI